MIWLAQGYLKDAETDLRNVEQNVELWRAKVVGLYVNTSKIRYIASNEDTTIGIKSLTGIKLIKWTISSFIVSAEQDVNNHLCRQTLDLKSTLARQSKRKLL